jgi:ribosomal protein S18 acetylase RimI-like enzyme
MKSEFHIRQFNFDNDYDRVLSLWQSIETGMNVGRSDTPEEIQRKIERDPDLFLISEMNGEIVGTVIGGFDGRRGMVYHLAVRSDVRRHGIGAALLTEVEKRLQSKGCVKIYLLVLEDNHSAIRFYEECGWKHQKHDFVFSKEF